MDVVRNAAYGGAAAVPDMLLNAPTNVLNLGKAAVGTIATALGRPDLAPELTRNPDLIAKLADRIGLTKEGVLPQGWQKALDALIRGGVGGALTGGASIPKALAGAGMGALSTGAAEGAGGMAGKLGASDAGQAAASNIAGLLAPKGVGAASALP